MGFKEFGSLSFHDDDAGHIKQFCSTPLLSHPDSRSDPIGGSEPSSGRETIYWDSLPDFFFLFFLNRTGTCGYGPHLVTVSKYHIHLPSPIYNYKTVLLHLQIRARNLHVVNPYWCVGPAVCGSLQMSSPVPTRIKTRAKIYA